MKVVLEDIHKGCSPYPIPKGWRLALLKELSLLKISNGAFNDPKCVGSGYKLINIVDLYQGPTVRTGDLGRLSLSESEYKTFKVQRGDIFFTRSSLKKEGIAHCNIFLSDEENVVYECHMMRVRPDPAAVDSKYLQEFCLAGPARDYFVSHGKTTTMTTIDQGSIGGLPVLLPPLPEQQKIAAILTTVDDKLDVITRQIEATQTLKLGLMQTLFSRGIGSQDTDGRSVPHAEFKDGELGTFPAAWNVSTIGTLFEVVERGVRMADEQSYRRVTVKRRYGGIELRDELRGGDIKVKSQFALEENDFLISERQIVHGACGIVPNLLAGALVSNEYLVLKARPSVDVRYFNYLVQQLKYAKYFMLCSQGVDIEKFLFKPKDWLKKLVPVPPISEQARIADVLATTDEKLNSLSSKQVELQQVKRGLMQKLLTGEWRVGMDATATGT